MYIIIDIVQLVHKKNDLLYYSQISDTFPYINELKFL